MAWTTLLNALFLPGKPIIGATGAALRDNIIAAFEGDATAVAAGVVLKLPALGPLVAGNTQRGFHAGVSVPVSSPAQRVASFDFAQSGQVRVTFSYSNTGVGPGSILFARIRAGSSTTIFSSNGSGSQSIDTDVQVGDRLIFNTPATFASNTSSLTNIAINTNGEWYWAAQPLNGGR